MGESFQDYSWIQGFELNLTDYNSISHLFSVSLKTIDQLNWKLLIFCKHNASFEIWISKVQDFWNLELSPMRKYLQGFHIANNQDAGQTARMRRLVFTFVVCTKQNQVFLRWGPYFIWVRLYEIGKGVHALSRDENLPLFRGFPLFWPKFAEINCFRFDQICSNLLHFEGGIGGFLFFDRNSSFLKKSCSHPCLRGCFCPL